MYSYSISLCANIILHNPQEDKHRDLLSGLWPPAADSGQALALAVTVRR